MSQRELEHAGIYMSLLSAPYFPPALHTKEPSLQLSLYSQALSVWLRQLLGMVGVAKDHCEGR